MITLFCLVQDESITNVFSVKIPPTDTVDDLKELIKKKKAPEFDTIAADKLKLWKVNINIDNASAVLKDLVLENNEEKGVQELIPVKKIFKVFPEEPDEEHIHIIVERPSCTSKCNE